MPICLPAIFRARFGLALAACFAVRLGAQSLFLSSSQTTIVAVPGFDHVPVEVGLTTSAALGSIQVTSDSTWVTAAVNATSGQLRLSFDTDALINRSYTATLTVTAGSASVQHFVKATVAPLVVTRLIDDPVRSRMYGIHQDGIEAGSLLVFDPLTLAPIGNLTLGRRPADLDIRPDGSEILVICGVDQTVHAVDPATLTTMEVFSLPVYGEWDAEETNPHVAYGPGSAIYYVDGNWGPVLHVYNRATGSVLQSIFAAGESYTGIGNASSGFGDVVVTPDGGTLYGWAQYGIGAGSMGSFAAVFTIAANGTLTFVAKNAEGMSRDPLTTPALVSADGSKAFLKKFAFAAGEVASPLRVFSSPVYAISPGAEIVSTDDAIFAYDDGAELYRLPISSEVQAISSDYARLVYYNSTTRTLQSVNLFVEIGAEQLGRETTPADGAIVTAPSELRWATVAGVDCYRVYLGESESAVAQAGPSSALNHGEVSSNRYAIPGNLVTGRTYYWRVDLVAAGETSPGVVHRFTVAPIAVSTSAIEAATVRGHAAYPLEVGLTAPTARAWTASANAEWVKVLTASGTTPATLRLNLDASSLPTGSNVAEVSVTSGGSTFKLPVRLHVEPLALTVLRSDPSSAMVYGISEVTETGDSTSVAPPQAYLLAIDAQSRAIVRASPVGRSATDLAIHHGDQRIYVPNWRDGTLRALNLATLELERTYGFAPFGGMGYSEGDVYLVAAGGPGRLVVEEQDQWIDIRIFDTINGVALDKAFVREGGGQYAPDRRHYYHGENNSSGAKILKFDTVADQFTLVASARGNISEYYGSRTVVVSDDGQRVFWSGMMYDASLAEVWRVGEVVHAASADGRYAFTETKIFDTVARAVIFGMPVATRVSAFNSTANVLVVQRADRLAYYRLTTSGSLATPVLKVGSRTASAVQLTWDHDGLQNGFTLQYRTKGASAWTDFAEDITPHAVSATVGGLSAESDYEFRLKADSGAASSAWSTVVTARTLPTPPSGPQVLVARVTSPTSIRFEWSVNGSHDSVTLERISQYPSSSDTWTVVATVPSTTTSYHDQNLEPLGRYWYRLKATRGGSDSAYTSTYSFQLETGSLPQIQSQSTGWTGRAGDWLSLWVNATGYPPPTFQWYRNGDPIPGATKPNYQVNAVHPAHAGTYHVVVSNSEGSQRSADMVVTVAEAPARLANLSVLSNLQGAELLTVGFYVSGSPKRILVRGLGPTIGALGVSGAMPDPRLALYLHGAGSPTELLTNNDWSTAENRAAILQATSAYTGLPFVADPSADAAALPTLYVSGGYSVQVAPLDGRGGAVLVEVYDADRLAGRLTNLSARALVTPSRPLTAGFVLEGRMQLLVRGVGPGLLPLGVAAAHRDPRLTLYRQQTPEPVAVAQNDDWSSSADRAAIAAASSGLGLQLADPSADAVLLVELESGAYTAQVSSADSTSGEVLVELYIVP